MSAGQTVLFAALDAGAVDLLGRIGGFEVQFAARGEEAFGVLAQLWKILPLYMRSPSNTDDP